MVVRFAKLINRHMKITSSPIKIKNKKIKNKMFAKR